MAALRFRFAPPTATHGAGGNYALTNNTDHSVGAGQHYVGDCSNPDPHAAVLRHDNLQGLPFATILVAQYDPLRDEGLAYAKALREAGVAVEVEQAPGMIHGFFSLFEVIPDAQPFIERVGGRLKAALN